MEGPGCMLTDHFIAIMHNFICRKRWNLTCWGREWLHGAGQGQGSRSEACSACSLAPCWGLVLSARSPEVIGQSSYEAELSWGSKFLASLGIQLCLSNGPYACNACPSASWVYYMHWLFYAIIDFFLKRVQYSTMSCRNPIITGRLYI